MPALEINNSPKKCYEELQLEVRTFILFCTSYRRTYLGYLRVESSFAVNTTFINLISTVDLWPSREKVLYTRAVHSERKFGIIKNWTFHFFSANSDCHSSRFRFIIKRKGVICNKYISTATRKGELKFTRYFGICSLQPILLLL